MNSLSKREIVYIQLLITDFEVRRLQFRWTFA